MKNYNAFSKSDMKTCNVHLWFESPFKINAMSLLVIHKSNENIKPFDVFLKQNMLTVK